MIDPSLIEAVVAEIFHVTVDDLRGRRRFLRHMHARHALAALMVQAGYGVTEAAELLSRHYSTISSSLRAAEQLIRDDPTYAAQLRLCKQAMTARAAVPAPTLAPATPPPEQRQRPRRPDAWLIEETIHIALFWLGGIPEVVSA